MNCHPSLKKGINDFLEFDDRPASQPSAECPRNTFSERSLGGCIDQTNTQPAANTHKLHHRCRNPRCGSKLREPVENPHAAFCTRGCWEQFHRHRCVVCERGFDRKVENKRLCERRLCRAEMRRWPAVYLPFQPQTANVDKPGTSEPEKTAPLPTIGNVQAGPQKAHEIRTKTRTKSLGGWCWVERLQAGFKPGVDHVEARSLHDRERRLAAQIAQEGEGWWVAYPVMTQESPIEPLEAAIKRAETVALWTLLPLDPATAQRLRTTNRARWRDHPRNPIKAQIQRHHAPLNLLGGYKFPNPPVLDLSPLDLPIPAENSASTQSGAIQSRWKPSTTCRDLSGDIPAFLKRAAS